MRRNAVAAASRGAPCARASPPASRPRRTTLTSTSSGSMPVRSTTTSTVAVTVSPKSAIRGESVAVATIGSRSAGRRVVVRAGAEPRDEDDRERARDGGERERDPREDPRARHHVTPRPPAACGGGRSRRGSWARISDRSLEREHDRVDVEQPERLGQLVQPLPRWQPSRGRDLLPQSRTEPDAARLAGRAAGRRSRSRRGSSAPRSGSWITTGTRSQRCSIAVEPHARSTARG